MSLTIIYEDGSRETCEAAEQRRMASENPAGGLAVKQPNFAQSPRAKITPKRCDEIQPGYYVETGGKFKKVASVEAA